MSCKGTCGKYKADKPPLPNTRYGAGQKRCVHCCIFIQWEGKYCPCCGKSLRINARGPKSKQLRLKGITRI